MLNRTEYLLAKAAEEGVEVAHRSTKALTFGLTEVHESARYPNPEGRTSAEILMEEFADLSCVIMMLQESGDLPIDPEKFAAQISAKRLKLDRYMEKSRRLGCLERA